MAQNYRQINPEGLAICEEFEGFRAVAYDDQQPNRTRWTSVNQVRGVPTIGIGHTKGVTKQDIIDRRRCTRAQALAWKREDLVDAYRKIYACVKLDKINALTDNQYSALVVFVFNCGLSSKWQIVQRLNAGRFDEVPDQMIRFVFDNGKRLQGLVNRRRAEIDLWREEENVHVKVATLAQVTPEAQPEKPVTQSRTFKASMVSGLSGVGTATAAGVAQLTPHANDGILKTILIVLVVIATVAAFLAAFFRAQDAAGAKA